MKSLTPDTLNVHMYPLLAINAFAVEAAATILTTPPFLLRTCRNDWSFSSKHPSVKGLPRFCNVILELWSLVCFFSGSSYFVLKPFAILSPNFKWGWVFSNFLTATAGPCTEVYSPILNSSWSVNEQYFSLFHLRLFFHSVTNSIVVERTKRCFFLWWKIFH